MRLIRNTLVFLDTGFFKDYKQKDSAYRKLMEYSRDNKIFLCTSYICLEEWRTQKVSHIYTTLQDLRGKLEGLQNNNFIARELLGPINKKFPDYEQIVKQSKKGTEIFIGENNIHKHMPREKHIWATWDAYFNGDPPFKQKKNRSDIPDAWIFECARDALADQRLGSADNKFCIGGDNALNDALGGLEFEIISVDDLLIKLENEEEGIVTEAEEAGTGTLISMEVVASLDEILSPLDALLAKAISANAKEIYLRLLGFVVPLGTPTHDSLVDAVAFKGFDRKLTVSCAGVLSDESKPYIKDTGSHYIVGDREICEAAADRLTQEIIDMLEQG
jgi:hypothetical protein